MIDRGVATGRTYLDEAAISGICGINNCAIFNTGGHLICLGNPTDNFTTQALRVKVNNLESGSGASDPAVRFQEAAMYIQGHHNEILTSVIGQDSVPGSSGIFVAGRDNHIVNNRFINCEHSVIVDSHPALSTGNIFVKGVARIGAVQNPKVVIQSTLGGNDPSGVVIDDYYPQVDLLVSNGTGVSSLSDLINVYPNARENIKLLDADFTVNNSTTPVSIPGFRFATEAGKKHFFEIGIVVSCTNASAGLRFRLSGTELGGLLYSPANGQVNSAGFPAVRPVSTELTTPGLYIIDAPVKQSLNTFCGVVSPTSNGRIDVQVAQTVATAANLTVHAGLSYIKWRRVYL